MLDIKMHSIGIIHSLYKTTEDIPMQGGFRNDVEGWIVLYKKFEKGLKDLEDFSHAYLLFYLHKTKKVHLEGKPFLEDELHGIFAIRSPHRPNHIGLSIIKINKIDKNKIYFSGVDMLDGTPVLDIKPLINQEYNLMKDNFYASK